MTSFGFISLDNATATYDPVKHQLRVSAEGYAPHGTHGFQFKQIPCIGGLKFELDAWTPRYRVGDRSYSYDQSFNIPSLTADAPSGEIIIVALNHPSGFRVTVRWLGYGGALTTKYTANGNGAQSLEQKDDTQVPNQSPGDADTITALYKEPFNVKEPIPASGRGFAKVLFDPYALIMVNSSVEDGIITWTLNSLNTGRTQVIVERYAVVLDNVLAQDKSIAQADSLSGTKESQGKAIPDFLGMILIAVRIIRKTVPEAQLLWVKATLPRSQPPRDLRQCNWAPPVFSSHKILGMHHTDVEKVPMDINGAVDAIRKHHITEAFWDASLESPSVAPEEFPDAPPYYVFHMVDGKRVWVSQTREICVTEVCERVFPKQGL